MTSSVADIRLAELQFITQAFINEQPSTITLLPSRGTSAQQPSGGHKYSPATARAPQTFRVSARGAGEGPVLAKTDGGRSVKYEYDLIGAFNATIEVGDTWDDTAPDGSAIHYKVEFVHPFNGYEVSAYVTSWATEPQHGDA